MEDEPMPKSHHLDRRADRLIAASTGSGDDLLTVQQLAEWLMLTVQTLEIYRVRGAGPKHVKLSPQVIRYKRSDVLKWLASRTRQSTEKKHKRKVRQRPPRPPRPKPTGRAPQVEA